MQIAEHITPHGMAAQDYFMQGITSLIKTKSLKKIIETGSYHGTGTTKAIVDGLTGGETVYSIEVNPVHYRKAKANNRKSPINFLLGLSVANCQKPTDLSWEGCPDHIVVDHTPENRNFLYQKEVMFNVPDNMMDFALSKFNYKPDLVILDSAGHMGLIEFLYLMERVKSPFYLALDDINHVKHYNTYQLIKDHYEKFEIIFETEQKFGSAIIKVS